MSKSGHDSSHRVLLVTYDLAGSSEEAAAKLHNELSASPGWWHYLESTWLVCTGEAPKALFGRLQPWLSEAGNVLIIEVRPNYFGLLPDKAWKWIDHHVNAASQGELIPHVHSKPRRKTGRPDDAPS